MARPIKKIELTEFQLSELTKAYKSMDSQVTRKAHAVLLKYEGLKSKEIAKIVCACEPTVNTWINNYLSSGLSGFQVKSGRGRKNILQESDASKVRKAVEKERQRLKYVKEELEQELNKEFSVKTLQRFLKNLTANSNDYV